MAELQWGSQKGIRSYKLGTRTYGIFEESVSCHFSAFLFWSTPSFVVKPLIQQGRWGAGRLPFSTTSLGWNQIPLKDYKEDWTLGACCTSRNRVVWSFSTESPWGYHRIQATCPNRETREQRILQRRGCQEGQKKECVCLDKWEAGSWWTTVNLSFLWLAPWISIQSDHPS